jgi:hypothetical protein
MHMHVTTGDGTRQKTLIRNCPLWRSAGEGRVCQRFWLDMTAYS